MSDVLTATPHRLLRTNEAADWLGLSGRTLEKHRTFGTGPAYRKIGGRVVYAMVDLQAWADRGARTSTTEPTEAAVSAARARREVRSFLS
ncbi:helix-turn-helix transcriptional regulator [Phenylobacterium kunshanense]|uniref:DNA-binding protein n=1 Tax=Phenylobacterium kunshanense TaxID=1445034 RepID=A0A328BKF6_9CAUL|nr:helix-turn-helix domain-containing protein [Phenylobacterium kunshanense]RAK66414.1 DNA-binding protein [Phenylobacterium kunshanense]